MSKEMTKKIFNKKLETAFKKWFNMPMDGLNKEDKETYTRLARIAFFNGAYWLANEIQKIQKT